ncbi:MAG TPA: radical SAM family heme chaperone HemW, partial [Gammaproteobacteria bacterium]|nr:radical SAM family heme chaperone HemW [Gammaproteobacteria bacterium]
MTRTRLPPLSLYVHLPWCVRKCPYCDFNSYEAKGPAPEREYVDALLRDLEAELPLVQDRPLESIFFGGGTPSLFRPESVARLIEGIEARIPSRADLEITLEANPGAVDAERFEGFRAAGVNRLSIGVQSFRDDRLSSLGRVHGAEEARRAVELARRAGFRNLNLDLMYGLPEDDVEGALFDLESALALEPEHVSWYQLTLEPNTAFHRKPPALPAEETVAAIEDRGRALLERRGYTRYEISAYAKEGARCRHNLNYWQFGDYLGIGAGAHGKATIGGECLRIVRRAKTRNPRTYAALAGSEAAVAIEAVDSPDQLVLEYVMGALRLTDGVTVEAFSARTGQPAGRLAA